MGDQSFSPSCDMTSLILQDSTNECWICCQIVLVRNSKCTEEIQTVSRRTWRMFSGLPRLTHLFHWIGIWLVRNCLLYRSWIGSLFSTNSKLGLAFQVTLMTSVFNSIRYVDGVRSNKLKDSETIQDTLKPFSAGVIQLNESIPYFLNCINDLRRPILEFPLGTLSSDCIESLFGELKMKFRVPGPREMSYAIRSSALAPVSYHLMKSNVGEIPLTSILSPKNLCESAKGLKRKLSPFPPMVNPDSQNNPKDLLEVERMMARCDEFRIDCKTCEAFIFTDSGFRSQLIVKAEALCMCNFDLVFTPNSTIKMFIDEVLKKLEIQEYQSTFPICPCQSAAIPIFLKRYLNLRIIAEIPRRNTGREHRFDSRSQL